MITRLTLCCLSLCLLGCSTLQLRRFSFRAWAERHLASETAYPARYQQAIRLSPQVSHPFTLILNSPTSAWIDCGNGVILRLKEEIYQDTWAQLTLADVDQDGIDDLIFTAQSHDTPDPLKAIFLYHAGKWEPYLLPPGF